MLSTPTVEMLSAGRSALGFSFVHLLGGRIEAGDPPIVVLGDPHDQSIEVIARQPKLFPAGFEKSAS